ncbi:MAG: aspartate--tRNA(Asn) ligase, partial [Candidatus Aenigmarchaeota archaeon]|nr:aspartate--tRNA(Asn) ligase [Candidatus Aenigmarchaeota archaeon]
MRTHYSSEIKQDLSGKTVRVAGWIRSLREHGNLKFITLTDRAGSVQITAKKGEVSDDILKQVSELRREFVVLIEGDVRKNDQAPNGV